MSDFSDSNWADSQFAQEYLDHAETYVPFRREMMETVRSFCSAFLSSTDKPRILDLGCGDGIMTSIVLSTCPEAVPTLVDGSQDMLDRAAERFTGRTEFSYIRATFQELAEEQVLKDTYDFAISSLAIHHLPRPDKESLYRYLYSHLGPGGHFLNLDVVLAPDDELESWYMELWRAWVDRQRREGVTDRDFSDITRRYQDNPDNVPDTLDFQLDALRRVGFRQVDCYYKYGVFVIFGGRKPA
ncbi:MAG: class I SAM-dependent methyltransferase [bacterium]|nr:MAG: class I SAM-dependent methyltransferase [bacterium]